MMGPSISHRPFALLDADQVKIAVEEIQTKFREDDVDNAAKRAHDKVALPLRKALKGGSQPKLSAVIKVIRKSRAYEVYVIQIGQRVFPIGHDKLIYGHTRLRLFEPVDVSKIKAEITSLKSIYGKTKPGFIDLERGGSMATSVQAKQGARYSDESYGWALYEAAASCIRMAQIDSMRGKDALEKTVGKAYDERLGGHQVETKGALQALLESASKPVNAIGGPPAGLAHDLLDATTWQGHVVALTSQRDTKAGVRVWLQDWQHGRTYWREIPWPEGEHPPGRGATLLLLKNKLHVFGGLDHDGDPTRQHWVYDLTQGSKLGFPSQYWHETTMTKEPMAWGVAAEVDGTPLVAGGVSAFYTESKEDGSKGRRLPNAQRAMDLLDGASWLKRESAPGDITASSVLNTDRCIFFGPGNNFSGKVYLYDKARGGAWYVLPQLPKKTGLGQLHFDNGVLIYSGGFSARGRASKDIYTLDLNRMDASWEKAGESDYAAGRARIVRSKDSWVSLMLTPHASRCFYIT